MVIRLKTILGDLGAVNRFQVRGSSALTWNRLTAPVSPRMTDIRIIKRIARPRERFRTKTSQRFYVFDKINSKLRNSRQQHMHMTHPVQSPVPTLVQIGLMRNKHVGEIWHRFNWNDGYNGNNNDNNNGKDNNNNNYYNSNLIILIMTMIKIMTSYNSFHIKIKCLKPVSA